MSLKWKSGARAVAVVGLVLFCGSCGDLYRPVANPVLQPGGDPQRTAHALVVSSNGSNQGAAVIIDVSGDTAVGSFTVGRNPVHAAFISGIDYIVNQADHNVNALILPAAGSQQDPSNSIITLPGPTPSAPSVPSANPVFAAAAGGKLFVTEPGLVAPSCAGPGNCVADISAISNSVSRHIPVGKNPVALVATPLGTQLYCLNKDDGTVTVIFPATDQVVATLPVGTTPVRGAVSSDGTRVFIVNQGSNNVSVIDTASDTVISTLTVGPGPNYITYQASLNRAYVTSPTDNSLSIIENATGTAPTVTIRTLAGAPCNAQHPISVTALADGSRVYVADDVTNTVCVLNTISNTFTTSIIPVGTAPVFIASNSDSTRVYTANSGSHDVSIIQTSSDTTVKQSDGVTPLTICAGPTGPGVPCTPTFVPTFIAMTP
jgi:YVTN family beta-propeller protein